MHFPLDNRQLSMKKSNKDFDAGNVSEIKKVR